MVSHPKIHPPGLVSDFQADEKSSIDKIAPKCRITCLILAFSGFPESPGLSASFTYGRLANQGMGSHPKIHPPGLVGDFQAAADSRHYATAMVPYHPCCQKHVGAKIKCVCDNKCICINALS